MIDEVLTEFPKRRKHRLFGHSATEKRDGRYNAEGFLTPDPMQANFGVGRIARLTRNIGRVFGVQSKNAG